MRDGGRDRPDLPEGSREGFDLSLLRWIRRYPTTDRPRVLAILSRLGPHVAVHRLHSRADVERFLQAL